MVVWATAWAGDLTVCVSPGDIGIGRLGDAFGNTRSASFIYELPAAPLELELGRQPHLEPSPQGRARTVPRSIPLEVDIVVGLLVEA